VYAVDPENPHALFILGMHRSGTSVMARMCNLLGYDLGQDLLLPRDDNESGFWENAAFVHIHEKMLDELCVDWSDYIPLEDNWDQQPGLSKLKQDLVSACEAQFTEGNHWCIKDPRISRLFPVWLSICQDLDLAPRVILMFRHPAAVAASVNRRNKIPHQDALLAWLAYTLDSIEYSDGSLRTFVSFESLQSDWRGVAEETLNDLGLQRTVSLDEIKEEMDSFFDFSLIHHDADISLQADDEIRSWCSDLFGALKLAESGELSKAEEVFQRVRSDFVTWTRRSDVAIQTIRNIRRQSVSLRKVETDMINVKAALLDRQKELLDREEQVHLLQSDVATLYERASQLDMVLGSLSWRITHPIRVLKRLVTQLFTPIPHKAFSFCRSVYRSLPLPHPRKLVLRGVFFRIMTVLRLSGGGKVSGLLKRRALPSPNDREIDFRFVEYRAPKVSIIIPVYNEVHYTLHCLRSIARCMPHVSFEIIVADDLSTDDTPLVMSQVPGIRYIRNTRNLGFLKNCNNAVTYANGEFIYLLNNDTQALPGFLDELVSTLEKNSDIGLAGSKLIFADGMLQEAGGIIWNDASGWNVGRGEDPDAPEYNFLRDVDYCSGCSILLRRSLWERLGGFDERFVPAYYEDTDLAFRIRQAGLRVVYQPLSAIVHFEGVSSGTDITSGVKAHQVKNQRKFLEKWSDCLESHRTNDDFDLALDRTISRRVLIIDSVTPTPDQDAGSLRTFNMIRMLINLESKVTFIPEDNIAHVGKFTEDLQRLGVECLYYPFLTSVQQYLRASAGQFDMIFLERGPVATKYVDIIKKAAPNVPVFFDTHDLHYLRVGRQAEVEKSATLLSESKSLKVMEYDVMQQSDCTIVVSEFESRIVSEEAPNVRTEILPLFMETEPLFMPFEERVGMLFIGGFRHQPNGDAVHHFVEEIWPRIKEEIPHAVFHIIGPDVTPDITALASDDILIEGFVSDLRPLFSKCRLSVAPLRFGAGVKGKIGTALAHGLPSVISSIAQEGSGLVDDEHVLVADRPEEFAEHVIRLYQDKALWTSLSENGVQFIEDNYSLAVNQERIGVLLDEFAPVGPSDRQDNAAATGADVPVIHAAELQSDRA